MLRNGSAPGDLVAILEALKEAGALRAQLIAAVVAASGVGQPLGEYVQALGHDVMRQQIDTTAVYRELEQRLREELDYVNEADNLRRMAALWAGNDEVVIPGVIDAASSRNSVAASSPASSVTPTGLTNTTSGPGGVKTVTCAAWLVTSPAAFLTATL